MMRFSIFFMLLTFLYSEHGDLVSIQVMSTKNITNNQIYIDNELSALASDDFFGLDVEYGFWLYKIVYETVDKFGNPTDASGVVAFPRVDWPDIPNQAFPILSYQHGTVLEKDAVTSHSGLWILPALIAGYGYVYIEPDYLGLGDSDGLHPYQIKESYGTDVVDMIRATRQFSDENLDFQVNNQLFLAGYSEGGYATMATHQIIERDYFDEMQITVSFPMAGAYSMSGIMTDLMLDYTSYGQPFYFPYVLFSYAEQYSDEIGPVENYLLPEYAEILPPLFDGYHSGDEINNAMPNIPITIMLPDSIETFGNNPNHSLRLSLQANDLYDWTPQSTMYIIHGLADELVPYENAQLAYDYFTANNSPDVHIELLPESFGGHADAAPFALLGAFQISEQNKVINELGDVNQDGMIDVLDVISLLNIILGASSSSFEQWAADINQDTNIDIFDIINQIQLILN